MAGGSNSLLAPKKERLDLTAGKLSKQELDAHEIRPLVLVSMKETVVVKGVWGVSPEVIAGLPGEAGRVKRLLG